MEDYEKMLESAFEKMPKKNHEKDRFQIPDAITEIQGNKTLVRNFGDIASVLRREPAHMAKFLFKELATPGNIQGSALIFQRKLMKDQIQDKIVGYVKDFVLCKICGEPDTKFVKEGRITIIQCDACGGRSPYKAV
ncbi:MAG: translation initiation factor IF-2 subunit beta [Candidatus Aenigmarchaeota archaeon]|nr:translation initiation factor IF-2 subunit beta [Candidatus Aenigmarchaeota archaeon]